MLRLLCTAFVGSGLFLSLAAYAQSGAFLVGQQKAKDLWNKGLAAGTYTCDGMSSVLDPTGPFITDARAQIKDAYCSTTYSLYPVRKADCIKGAEAFVAQQASACTKVPEDCNQIGDTAASEVGASFCTKAVSVSLAQFTPVCRLMAENRCKTAVYDQLALYFPDSCKAGKIKSLADLSLQDATVLNNECMKTIDELSKIPVEL
jgi:hypothetical protein